MIAIAKIGGHQAIVQVGETIEVDKLDVEAGKKVKFETLLVSDESGKDFQIGSPIIKGAEVEAKVIEHGKGDKVRVYKMKPRKRYRRTQGHRQDFTLIEITKIGGAAPKVKKAAAPKKADEAPKAKKTTEKKETAKKD